MCGSCGRGKRHYVQPKPMPAPPLASPPTQKIIQTNQKSQGQGIIASDKFCRICGWAIKPSKFVDPITNRLVEKIACTNRTCSNYKK